MEPLPENETNSIPGNEVISGVYEVQKEMTELEPGAWASQTKDQDKIVSCSWINNQDRYLQTFHF
ncbi:hypothetical protein J6590_104322 [Homalodisca vitripennis]|nr:hypothetical protein J6590_104322 [Homalodisca vitripennis]